MPHNKEHDTFIPVGGLSFLVRIQFCQNNTWQGTVQWLDKKITKHFRSLLELIQLMNEAVCESTQIAPETHPWIEKEGAS